jgi:hypothetical protein
MIPLPPGAVRNYEIRFKIKTLTKDIGNWFVLIGGQAWAEQEFDWRGRQVLNNYVQYGKAKASYTLKDSTDNVLIRFNGNDASAASMFLIKFFDDIIEHNMKDYYAEQGLL